MAPHMIKGTDLRLNGSVYPEGAVVDLTPEQAALLGSVVVEVNETGEPVHGPTLAARGSDKMARLAADLEQANDRIAELEEEKAQLKDRLVKEAEARAQAEELAQQAEPGEAGESKAKEKPKAKEAKK